MSIESFIEFGKAAEKVATALGDLAQALDVVSQTPCFTTPPWKENPSVMISINPKWCEKIASGIKTVEIRKTKPKIETPFKCYIYQTKHREHNGHTYSDGKVIGEFICDCIANYEAELWDDETFERIQEFYEPDDFNEYGEYEYKTIADNSDDFWKENMLCKSSCVNIEELRKYLGVGITEFYGWNISNLVIYDKPKELNEFYVLDNEEVKKCKNRIQTYSSFTDTGYIKNGMYCDYKDDWCVKCKRKPLKRPFQSWGYAENYTEDT